MYAKLLILDLQLCEMALRHWCQKLVSISAKWLLIARFKWDLNFFFQFARNEVNDVNHLYRQFSQSIRAERHFQPPT